MTKITLWSVDLSPREPNRKTVISLSMTRTRFSDLLWQGHFLQVFFENCIQVFHDQNNLFGPSMKRRLLSGLLWLFFYGLLQVFEDNETFLCFSMFCRFFRGFRSFRNKKMSLWPSMKRRSATGLLYWGKCRSFVKKNIIYRAFAEYRIFRK